MVEMNARLFDKNDQCSSRQRTGNQRRALATVNTTQRCLFLSLGCLLLTSTKVQGLLFPAFCTSRHSTSLSLIPPPGSGYIGPDDEMADPGNMPDTYKPLMGYPGTMRPGTTLENMPYQDLPISDSDPDPVPWPHFQEIQWHHRWDPPHPNPDTMEDVIEKAGRWATPEQEAAIRAGARSSARQMQEAAEQKKQDYVITDDEEDTDMDIREEPLSLGDGIFGKLGSDDDRALTERAVSPEGREEEMKAEKVDDGMDDFLSDLGLDLELGDEAGDDTPEAAPVRSSVSDEELNAPQSNDSGVTASIEVEDDEDELSVLGLDDEDDGVGSDGTIPLDDFDSDEFDTGTENFFDEGGFDIGDDGGDFDGGDDW